MQSKTEGEISNRKQCSMLYLGLVLYFSPTAFGCKLQRRKHVPLLISGIVLIPSQLISRGLGIITNPSCGLGARQTVRPLFRNTQQTPRLAAFSLADKRCFECTNQIATLLPHPLLFFPPSLPLTFQ